MRNGLRILLLMAVALVTVAWKTDQGAHAFCDGNQGKIDVSFTNKESRRGINVVATDLQSGASVNLGTVAPGATGTGSINTGKVILSSGTVRFHLTWSDGSSGSDSRSADYGGVNCTPPEAPPEEPPEEGPPPEEPPAPPPATIWTQCLRYVRGQVLDRHGNPIAGIQVLWDEHILATTNAEGYYQYEFTPQGSHTIRVLWEEHNAEQGTNYFFSQPVVTVVVGDACQVYPASPLIDPVLVQVRIAPQPQPEARPSLAELRFIRFLEGWEFSGPTRI